MVKRKRKAEAAAVEEEKEKEKERANQNQDPSLSQNVVGMQEQQQKQQQILEQQRGEQAPTVPSGVEGVQVQAGQFDQINGSETATTRQVTGVTFQSNVVKYKGRKTEFLTLPMRLVQQEGYPFKGTNKTTKVKITLTVDGSKLIVERE